MLDLSDNLVSKLIGLPKYKQLEALVIYENKIEKIQILIILKGYQWAPRKTKRQSLMIKIVTIKNWPFNKYIKIYRRAN